VAKDIAISLKYNNTKHAVIIHVDDKYKKSYENVVNTPGSRNATPDSSIQKHTILINKSGVIQLIMKSKLPKAIELQEWLLEVVIPEVLQTGKFNGDINPVNSINDVSLQINKLFTEQNKIYQLMFTEQNKKHELQMETMIAEFRSHHNEIMSAFTGMITAMYNNKPSDIKNYGLLAINCVLILSRRITAKH
jgi:prophage antirepressor-like protein